MGDSLFYIDKVCCVYSLKSPRWGGSYENTQHTFMLKKIENDIPSMPSDLALWLTPISSNYTRLETFSWFQGVRAIEILLYPIFCCNVKLHQEQESVIILWANQGPVVQN